MKEISMSYEVLTKPVQIPPAFPRVTAYFTVSVSRRDRDVEDIEREVSRYLYGGFMLLAESQWNEEYTRLILTVRFAGYRESMADSKARVQYQRDRLSSGLISSTDPLFYLPVKES